MEDSSKVGYVLALAKTLLILSGFSDDVLEKILQEFAITSPHNPTLNTNSTNANSTHATSFPIGDAAYDEAKTFGYVFIITPLFMLIRFGVGYIMLKQNISKAGSKDEERKKKIKKFAKNQADRFINDIVAPILGYGFGLLGTYLGWLDDSETTEHWLAAVFGVTPSLVLEAITYVKTGLGGWLSKYTESIVHKLLGDTPGDKLPVRENNNNDVESGKDLSDKSYATQERIRGLTVQNP